MTEPSLPKMPPAFAEIFGGYPPEVADRLSAIRGLIFGVAQEVGVAPLTETLKWGEPAYLTEATKTGTTIRLDWRDGAVPEWAMFVPCSTDLLDRYRSLPGCPLRFDGDRAVLGALDAPLPKAPLATCIRMALMYHADKRARAHG